MKYLTILLFSESAPNIIEFLLVHAKRLKSVQFGSTAWFNDDTVAKVLAKGDSNFPIFSEIFRFFPKIFCFLPKVHYDKLKKYESSEVMN